MMPQADVNYWAVLVAALANMVIGAIWYNPRAFGTAWMRLTGRTMADAQQQNARTAYLLTFLAALLAAYVLSLFVDFTRAANLAAGAWTGILLWLGLVATTGLANFVFEGKPWSLYAIVYGHHLVALAVMGAIVAVWA